MEKFQVKGVEVTFDDLTAEVQKILYLKDKEKFQLDAAGSQHSKIRKLVASEEITNLEVLNEMFMAERMIWNDIDIIKLVWNHKNFKRTDDKAQELAKSSNSTIRLIVAKCEDSSSEILNEMLREETINGTFQARYIVDAIFANSKFQMEQETLSILSKSDWWFARFKAAEYKDSSSEILNEMLREEVHKDLDIVEAILANPKFQMEQETLKALSESELFDARLEAAKSVDFSSKSLNEMLRNEVQNEEHQEDTIIYAILDNPQFQMEQETLNVLVKSEKYKYRLIAAKSTEISEELLEEMYYEEDDSDVQKAIEKNMMNRVKNSKANISLNIVQKKRCMEVLGKVRKGDKEKTLASYLQEILDVIG